MDKILQRLRHSSFRLVPLFAVVMVSVLCGEDIISAKDQPFRAKWKEVVVGNGTSYGVWWCGSGSRVVWALSPEVDMKKKGIRLADIRTRKVKTLVYGGTNPSCSADGRFVFLNADSPEGNTGLSAYDFRKGRTTELFSHQDSVPVTYAPLSPCGTAIVGPKRGPSRMRLSDDFEVDVLSVFENDNERSPKYDLVGWFKDCERALIFEFPSDTLFIASLKNRAFIPVSLSGLRGERLTFSRDGRFLYFLVPATSKREEHSYNLYRLGTKDLLAAKAVPQLLIEGLGDYDVAADGSLVFLYSDAYTKRPGLYLADADGRNSQRLTDKFDFEPKFSADGRAIAFVRYKAAPKKPISAEYYSQTVINVLVRD